MSDNVHILSAAFLSTASGQRSSIRNCLIVLVSTFVVLPAFPQGFNFDIGMGPGFPIGKTNNLANPSYNFVVGGGVNLHSHFKLSSEFMFHGLPVSDDTAQLLTVSEVKGRLYALTANLIVGSSIGGEKSVYLIGGGGWYRRTLELRQTVLQAGSKCAPLWEWWNVQCVNGIFADDITVGSRTSSAGGFDIGGGLAFRLGDSGANFYTEIRYHRAFTRNVETEVLPVTFGVRW